MKHTQGSTTALGMGGQGTHPARGAQLDLSTLPVHQNAGWVEICSGFLIPSPPGAQSLAQFRALSQPAELQALFLFLGWFNLLWTSSRCSDPLLG